jgi:predicted lipase
LITSRRQLWPTLPRFPLNAVSWEAGHATFAEWKQLISRHAGFFNYDPDTRAYCMITIPATWRDTPGPTWQLVAAMLRNQRRQIVRESTAAAQQRLDLP